MYIMGLTTNYKYTYVLMSHCEFISVWGEIVLIDERPPNIAGLYHYLETLHVFLLKGSKLTLLVFKFNAAILH